MSDAALHHASTDPKRLSFLLLVFFFSGVSSLAYQIVWQKALSQLIGVDHYSVTLIVSIFMLGLGLGGALGIPITRSRWNLISIYVLVESSLAVFGVFSLQILRGANAEFQSTGYLHDFLVNFLILMTPTILMGLSLPLVVHLFRNTYQVGSAIAIVYSANIAGAAVGALSTGFILIGAIGMTASCRLAATINALLGLSTWLFSRSASGISLREERQDHSVFIPSSFDPQTFRVFALSFVSGFVALGYEIVFFRIFTTYFGAISYVFSLLIFAYLALMSAGNYCFGRAADKNSRSTLFLSAGGFAIVTTLMILWGQEFMNRAGLRPNYLVLWPFRTWLVFAQIPPVLVVSLVLMTPIAFISGFFPVIVRSATRRAEDLGSKLGGIYFTQTLGNCAGSLVTGLLLLPWLGTTNTLRLFAGLLAFLVWVAHAPNLSLALSGWRQKALAMVSLGAVLVYPSNFYSTVKLYYEGDEGDVRAPAAIRESAFGATLAYQKPGRPNMEVYVGRFFSNSFPMKPASLAGIEDCFPTEWIGGMKGLEVRRALYVGIGSGVGPFCIQKIFPKAELDIVEINPDLLELMEEHGAEAVVEAIRRSHVYVMDGRRFVQRFPDKHYDFIQVGVFAAWASGAGNLFTREFWEILSRRLTPNGGVTYNAYPAAVKSGLEVFRHLTVLCPGPSRISDVWATNSSHPIGIDPDQFEENRKRLASQSGPGTVRIHERYVHEGCLIPERKLRPLLATVSASTDDKPVTEYFLTNNQFMYALDWKAFKPKRDMRMFSCEDSSPSLETLLKR